MPNSSEKKLLLDRIQNDILRASDVILQKEILDQVVKKLKASGIEVHDMNENVPSATATATSQTTNKNQQPAITIPESAKKIKLGKRYKNTFTREKDAEGNPN